jgi:aminoglycoside phosphotransferase (APT) family kinase protein
MAISDDLSEWVERETGGQILGQERPETGGSRELYFLDLEHPDGARSVVLRIEGGGSFSGTEISLAKEATVYRALAGTDVPAPRLIALKDDGSALLLERVEGTTELGGLPEEERRRSLDSFVDALAAMHNLDVDELSLDGFNRPRTATEHATFDLGAWARMADEGVTDLDPLITYALGWLRAHAPHNVARTVLVQGDTGPGNFVVSQGRVTGVIDWEFSHLGDPMDDLAWLEYRWATSGLDRSDFERQLERYVDATGITVEHAAIAYYSLAVQVRCAITTSLALSRGGGARGLAPYLLVTQQYLVGIAKALSELSGVVEPILDLPLPNDTPRTPLFQHVLDSIRSGVREIADPPARDRTRDAQIFLHYLRAYDQIGAQIEGLDAKDQEDSLEFALHDSLESRKRIDEAGAAADEPVLRYLLRRGQRSASLWASLLSRKRR